MEERLPPNASELYMFSVGFLLVLVIISYIRKRKKP